jgi:hypothetical protein
MSMLHRPLTSAHESGRRRRSALGIACLGAIAAALVAASAPGASVATPAAVSKCKPGVTGNWVQDCGPAAATARFSGKVVRWTSGSCRTVNGVLRLHIGRHPLRGLSPKTKYWEHTSTAQRDGAHRKGVYVEWWLGKTQYVLVPPMKVTYRNNLKRGTFTGTLKSALGGVLTSFRDRGKASGTFHC